MYTEYELNSNFKKEFIKLGIEDEEAMKIALSYMYSLINIEYNTKTE